MQGWERRFSGFSIVVLRIVRLRALRRRHGDIRVLGFQGFWVPDLELGIPDFGLISHADSSFWSAWS